MSSPARVLAIGTVYPPHHLGGYEIIWRGVMGHLREQGHLTRVLVTGHRQPEVPAYAEEDPGVYRELEWYWSEHRWRSLSLRARLGLERRNASRFDHHVRELRPEVIAWWPVGGLSLSLIERARRAGIASVLFVLDPWLSYGRERDLWLRTCARLGPAAKVMGRLSGVPAGVDWSGAGRWVFCSETMRRNTAAAGLRLPAGVILRPGVERCLLALPPEAVAPPWRWRLLYLGRVVEQKGVATAVAALSRLPPEARLTVVGDGDAPYRRHLERLATRLGVRERVHLRGPCARAELPVLLRSSDAVVFPVQWPEPWGLVPLEAMAAGRPVIATGAGGSGEYLVDERNSLLFTAGDAEALAARVQRLAADSGLRERLRAGGLATANAHTAEAFNRQAADEILAAAKAPRPPR